MAEAKAVPLYIDLAAQHLDDAELHQKSYATTEMYIRRHIATRCLVTPASNQPNDTAISPIRRC